MNSMHTVIVCATFTIKKAWGNPFTNNPLFAYKKICVLTACSAIIKTKSHFCIYPLLLLFNHITLCYGFYLEKGAYY